MAKRRREFGSSNLICGPTDVRFTPKSGHLVERVVMSALCQKRTFDSTALFDQLVGTSR